MKVNLKDATADQLAAILSSESLSILWTPEDEEKIWQQLLASSILLELEELGVGSQLLNDACLSANPRIQVFQDLIGHPAPPANVLNAVRRLAKTQALEAGASGIAPMARALYYATVATALIAGMKITKLGEDGLLGGLAWMRDQPWLDEKTRQVIDQARKKCLD